MKTKRHNMSFVTIAIMSLSCARVLDKYVFHLGSPMKDVIRSIPWFTGNETDRSRRLESVSGDTRKMLHRKLKKF